jgi:lambda repressor-like predicted transcriptional regulator
MQPITESKKPRNWTRKRINAGLKARGFRQRDVVKETGRSQPMVSEVVAARRKSWPIAWAVARRHDRKPWEIWPRLYAAPPSEEPSSESTSEPDQGSIARAC